MVKAGSKHILLMLSDSNIYDFTAAVMWSKAAPWPLPQTVCEQRTHGSIKLILSTTGHAVLALLQCQLQPDKAVLRQAPPVSNTGSKGRSGTSRCLRRATWAAEAGRSRHRNSRRVRQETWAASTPGEQLGQQKQVSQKQ
eukprot:scaffold182453_cov19-Tisochrysis_lutea.AAC.2